MKISHGKGRRIVLTMIWWSQYVVWPPRAWITTRQRLCLLRIGLRKKICGSWFHSSTKAAERSSRFLGSTGRAETACCSFYRVKIGREARPVHSLDSLSFQIVRYNSSPVRMSIIIHQNKVIADSTGIRSGDGV